MEYKTEDLDLTCLKLKFLKKKDDPRKLFQQKVNNWIEKWYAQQVIDSSLKSFILCDSTSAGKIYGLARTHKFDNPVRIVTSGCNTAVENLSVFVESLYIKKLKEFHLELGTPAIC